MGTDDMEPKSHENRDPAALQHRATGVPTLKPDPMVPRGSSIGITEWQSIRVTVVFCFRTWEGRDYISHAPLVTVPRITTTLYDATNLGRLWEIINESQGTLIMLESCGLRFHKDLNAICLYNKTKLVNEFLYEPGEETLQVPDRLICNPGFATNMLRYGLINKTEGLEMRMVMSYPTVD